MIKYIVIFLALFSTNVFAAENPVATDSRIRTYVYGENEVFKIITKHGYQANVQFGDREEIQTLSIGDAVSWKVTPAGNRLFVKSMEQGNNTNMTVVTNERSYQFDLSSEIENEEDIVYVVRFYYPETDFDSRKRRPDSNAFESGALIDAAYNFNYSLTGPRTIAPIQVFDDGKFTFFKFAGNNAVVPSVSMVDGEGNEIPLVSRDDGEYIVVERVFKQFSLRKGDGVVCVFNDSMIGGGPSVRGR
jgi:type IV secretion system protein VirB9